MDAGDGAGIDAVGNAFANVGHNGMGHRFSPLQQFSILSLVNNFDIGQALIRNPGNPSDVAFLSDRSDRRR